jgi:hypothetical protein
MKINSDDPHVINISPGEFQQLTEKPLLIDVRFSLLKYN